MTGYRRLASPDPVEQQLRDAALAVSDAVRRRLAYDRADHTRTSQIALAWPGTGRST